MATVKSGDVDRFIRSIRQQAPIVLVHGPDLGLVSERVAACVEASGVTPGDSFAISRIDGDALADDPAALLDAAGAVGLFGGDRIVIVRLGGRSIDKAITPLLGSPPSHCRIIIQAGDIAARHPLRIACERSANATTLPCYPDGGRELGRLIDEICATSDVRFVPEARELLTFSLGSDRLQSRSEIQKLVTFMGEGRLVGVADVEAIVTNAAPAPEDTAIDAAFLGQGAVLLSALSSLRRHDGSPELLIGAAARHGALLLRLVADRADASRVEESLRASRIFWKRQDAVKRQVALWSAETLRGAVISLHAAWGRSRRRSGIGAVLVERALWSTVRLAQSSRKV